jgi:hypothetical protein
LKKRFRILRLPFTFYSEHHITNTFKVCCILHNMLLEYHGHLDAGQCPSDWKALDDADVRKIDARVTDKVRCSGA